MLYFDHAASSPLSPSVLEALAKSQEQDYANPHARNKYSRALAEKIEAVRGRILNCLDLDHNLFRVIFLSSTTEANNLMANVAGSTTSGAPKASKVFISRANHPSLVRPIMARFPQKSVFYSHNQRGELELDSLYQQLEMISSPSPILFLGQHVNSTSGNLYPMEQISREIKRINPQSIIMWDLAQSFGKLRVSLANVPLDAVSLSAHKMGGPKGIAALVVKKSQTPPPLIWGGGQELNARSSTLATPLIMGWDQAMREIDWERQNRHQQDLKEWIRDLREEFSQTSWKFWDPFAEAITTPYIFSCGWENLSSDILLRHFEQKSVVAASSSACSGRSQGPNEVLADFGIQTKFHKSLLRLSFSSQTQRSDLITLKQITREILRDLSHLA